MGLTTSADWSEIASAPVPRQRRLISEIGDVAPAGLGGTYAMQLDTENAVDEGYSAQLFTAINRMVPAITVQQSVSAYVKLTANGLANERRAGFAAFTRARLGDDSTDFRFGVFPAEDLGGYLYLVQRGTGPGTQINIDIGVWVPTQPFNYADPFGVRFFVNDINAADVHTVLQIDQNHNGFETVSNEVELASPLYGDAGANFAYTLTSLGGVAAIAGQKIWYDNVVYGNDPSPVAPIP
jgi:hypothetical protein